METILMTLAALSFVAFVVGMFNPQVVKCSSRGKVVLIFPSVFLICAIIGGSIMEGPEISNKTSSLVAETPKEVKTLTIGDVLTLPYANSNVEIAFKDIKINRIPNNGLNLVFTLRIKNNSNDTFFISNAKWKLLDSEKIEVEESGIYEPMFGDFTPGMFFFTVVEPNIGKEEQVGYSIKEETYYLSLNGHIVAKIPLDNQ